MDGPGTYSQPPYSGGSKDESGTAAKDTISIGSGDHEVEQTAWGWRVILNLPVIDFSYKRVKILSIKGSSGTTGHSCRT